MPIDADTAAWALADAWESLLRSTPGWWVERRGGAVAGITKVQVPTLNGVWAFEIELDSDVISGLLDQIVATGLPHCLQVRPGAAGRIEELASRRAMVPDEGVPLMVLERADSSTGEDLPAGLTIRALAPADADQHVVLAASGFGAAEEAFRGLLSREVVCLAGLRMYLGEVDGEPVTTGLGYRCGDSVGVFNIATPPAHRRRGYGAAVTMRAVRDGFDSGASWAWLQSSPFGLPVYERLGFRTVESWPCWLAGG